MIGEIIKIVNDNCNITQTTALYHIDNTKDNDPKTTQEVNNMVRQFGAVNIVG